MSRKRSRNDLVMACEVYWGKYETPEDCNLRAESNPESEVITKDLLDKLSEEAKIIAEVLINLPDEMFLGTGRVIKKELIKYMKVNFNWTAEKTVIVQNEVAQMFSSR